MTSLAHRHSHISTRTSLYSHSHIPRSLAHYDRTFSTFRLAHNLSLAPQSLAHHRTRTFHVHSHVMTGPLAHHRTRTL